MVAGLVVPTLAGLFAETDIELDFFLAQSFVCHNFFCGSVSFCAVIEICVVCT